MDAEALRALLEQLKAGEVDTDAAVEQLKRLPFSDLGYARVDHHRALRLGLPEVVLGQGKTPEQILGIARALIAARQSVLVTRLAPEAASVVIAGLPEMRYSPVARIAKFEHEPVKQQGGAPVAVVTAGTSDMPVAEEAFETLEAFGIPALRVYDVGVAGIHRLFSQTEVLAQAPAVIVVAGMEGALPSVVGGLLGSPIVAVPTSIGYGAALGGFTALCGMLTGCASGVTVVNIDNGFGAAMAVARIVSTRSRLGGAP
jgi:hypothetical protein